MRNTIMIAAGIACLPLAAPLAASAACATGKHIAQGTMTCVSDVTPGSGQQGISDQASAGNLTSYLKTPPAQGTGTGHPGISDQGATGGMTSSKSLGGGGSTGGAQAGGDKGHSAGTSTGKAVVVGKTGGQGISDQGAAGGLISY